MPTRPDPSSLARFVAMALDCVDRTYPNGIAHVLASDDDAQPPRALHPAFYGCFDWHSAVHGHWLIARALRLGTAPEHAERSRAALARSLTPSKIDAEARYVARRKTFERPYGLAWVLMLAAELRAMDGEARAWSAALEPLAGVASRHLCEWLAVLSHPIRSGVHSQTAFAMGLALDAAREIGDPQLEPVVADRALAFHVHDRSLALHLEPSGEDFLSPSLGVADLMRRVMTPSSFAGWLYVAIPEIPDDGRADWLVPVPSPDPSDGRLAHLDGLTLSRAFMLEGIASALPDGDPRSAAILASAAVHSVAGLAGISEAHYEGAHWLGTFATYLLTRRGLGSR